MSTPQIPAGSSQQDEAKRVLQKMRDDRIAREERDARLENRGIFQAPEAFTPTGMFDPSRVNLEEARQIRQREATFAPPRVPPRTVVPPTTAALNVGGAAVEQMGKVERPLSQAFAGHTAAFVEAAQEDKTKEEWTQRAKEVVEKPNVFDLIALSAPAAGSIGPIAERTGDLVADAIAKVEQETGKDVSLFNWDEAGLTVGEALQEEFQLPTGVAGALEIMPWLLLPAASVPRGMLAAQKATMALRATTATSRPARALYSSAAELMDAVDLGLLPYDAFERGIATLLGVPIKGVKFAASKIRGQSEAVAETAEKVVDERMSFGSGTPKERYAYAVEAPDEHPRLDRYKREEVELSTDSQETADVILSAKGNPEATVTIYRAVPEGVDEIDAGDWVALSPEYAGTHIRPGVPGKVISKQVTAKEVAWARTDDNEWLFAPTEGAAAEEVTKVIMREEQLRKTPLQIREQYHDYFINVPESAPDSIKTTFNIAGSPIELDLSTGGTSFIARVLPTEGRLTKADEMGLIGKFLDDVADDNNMSFSQILIPDNDRWRTFARSRGFAVHKAAVGTTDGLVQATREVTGLSRARKDWHATIANQPASEIKGESDFARSLMDSPSGAEYVTHSVGFAVPVSKINSLSVGAKLPSKTNSWNDLLRAGGYSGFQGPISIANLRIWFTKAMDEGRVDDAKAFYAKLTELRNADKAAQQDALRRGKELIGRERPADYQRVEQPVELTYDKTNQMFNIVGGEARVLQAIRNGDVTIPAFVQRTSGEVNGIKGDGMLFSDVQNVAPSPQAGISASVLKFTKDVDKALAITNRSKKWDEVNKLLDTEGFRLLDESRESHFFGEVEARKVLRAQELIERSAVMPSPKEREGAANEGRRLLQEASQDGLAFFNYKVNQAGFPNLHSEMNFGLFGERWEPSLRIVGDIPPERFDAFRSLMVDIADINFKQESLLVHTAMPANTPLGRVGPSAPGDIIEPVYVLRFLDADGAPVALTPDQTLELSRLATTERIRTGNMALPFATHADGAGIDMIHVSGYNDLTVTPETVDAVIASSQAEFLQEGKRFINDVNKWIETKQRGVGEADNNLRGSTAIGTTDHRRVSGFGSADGFEVGTPGMVSYADHRRNFRTTDAAEETAEGLGKRAQDEFDEYRKNAKVYAEAGEAGYAGNIKLNKFSAEAQAAIKATSRVHGAELEDYRRSFRPDEGEGATVGDARIRELAYGLTRDWGGDADAIFKMWQDTGVRWNAEEIQAVRLTLKDKSERVWELAKALKDKRLQKLDTTIDKANLYRAMEEQKQMQAILTGLTAEAGRALRVFRQRLGKIDDVMRDYEGLEEFLAQAHSTQKWDDIVDLLVDVDFDNPQGLSKLLGKIDKPGWWDYIMEVYINSILSGISTQVVNAMSNAANVLISPIERGMAAGVERVVAPLQRRQVERFFSEVPAEVSGILQGLPEGISAGFRILMQGADVTKASKFEVRAKAFKGKFGEAIRMPGTLLESSDALFYAINYNSALKTLIHREAKRKGMKGEDLVARVAELTSDPPLPLIREAEKTAEYRLFRADLGPGLNTIMRLRTRYPWTRFIIPFMRTPANLITYGLVRSPAGLANPNMWRAFGRKDPEFADQMGRALMGSMATLGIAFGFQNGNITGAAPTDASERDAFYRSGKLPYSVRFGDTWVQYNRLEPFNQVFAQVGAVYAAMDSDDADLIQKASIAITTMADNLVSQHYMSGLADVLDAVRQPERYGQRYFDRLATGMVPYSSLMRQVAQTIDPTFRRPTEGIIEGLSQGKIPQPVAANLPFLSRGVPPIVTALGDEPQRASPPLSPVRWSPAEESNLNLELERLNIDIPLMGKTIAGQPLTPTQQLDFQREAGNNIRNALQRLIATSSYNNRTNAGQEDLIDEAIRKAIREARESMLETLPPPEDGR